MNSFSTHLKNQSLDIGLKALLALFILFTTSLKAQTPTDGLMMTKGKMCNVAMYSFDRWDHYWEGTLERKNPNLGKVTTQSVMYMAALGITDRLNIMAGLPYIWTRPSAGTLQGRSGIQDLSLEAKFRALKVEVPFGALSVFTVLGFSTPLTNYTPDFLPMSIGLHSTTGSLRGILHYQTQLGIFATVQGGYIRRSNTKIDRTSYYTDKLYYSNEVVVPDATNFSVRAGYNSPKLIAELWIDRFYSLSGNDIRRNDMPFPANAMRSTKVGIMGLYRVNFLPGLGFNAGASYTLNGRNVGQSASFSAGVQYVISLWKPKATN